jgi:Mg-chelatase subunit ChlI
MSIVDYKRSFDSRLQAYEFSGNKKMEDGDIALDFMYGLDNARYAEFKAEIVNDAAKVIKDLNEMYVLASRRVVVKKNQTTIAGASFATLADKVTKQPKNNTNNNNEKNVEKKPDEKDKDADKKTTDDKEKAARAEAKKQERLKNATCYNCYEKGHFARDSLGTKLPYITKQCRVMNYPILI